MTSSEEDLIVSLQTSLRNAHNTFGPKSSQYLEMKDMVENIVNSYIVKMEAQKGSTAETETGSAFLQQILDDMHNLTLGT
ncbi:hypothetical protein P154DRAFT_520573 [Amniculicola lignicola CBS 123094]|uniref:Uncharacterized protein n=1 Tax=Amniculicola lignicola CBS 123094 TaxID=1392246 RepID=A0A6A5WPI1_9PLEO|nr:hypothetical protein P154DRAFT_520573 [Amniculicola lignicola CBS 123094]